MVIMSRFILFLSNVSCQFYVRFMSLGRKYVLVYDTGV